ncbi:hypothetical protein M8J77_007723 [Diaphorina citri]|nr:hypothetical protein M8J77_007723 [Diaphorina citri]
MEDRSPCKEVVHKCNSDPGGGRRSIGIQEDSGGGISRRTRSGSSYSHIPVARKCVLTLDGYSYVIDSLKLCPHEVDAVVRLYRSRLKPSTLPRQHRFTPLIDHV